MHAEYANAAACSCGLTVMPVVPPGSSDTHAFCAATNVGDLGSRSGCACTSMRIGPGSGKSGTPCDRMHSAWASGDLGVPESLGVPRTRGGRARSGRAGGRKLCDTEVRRAAATGARDKRATRHVHGDDCGPRSTAVS